MANNPRGHVPPEVREAIETLAAHPEAARAAGIFDPWRVDDLLENQVIPELRAIRTLLEAGQLPNGDRDGTGGSLIGVLQDIRRNTAAVVAPSFNKDNLPLDVVGLTVERIGEGGEGEALFEIEGTNFLASVRSTGATGQFDPVQVIDEGNIVRPARPDVQDAFGGLADAFVEAARFDRVETADNVVIDPGDTETVLEFAVENGAWLEVGTRDVEFALYQYFVDDEALLSEPLTAPLGLFNDPYVFPRPVKIDAVARVDVTLQADAPGSEEFFSKATFTGEQP